MVIDDEDSLRTVMRLMLEQSGYEVMEMRDGEKATAALALRLPDLVITDLLMPAKDGMEIIIDLRRTAPQVPIIAISGGGIYTDSDDLLQTAAVLGVQRILPKPFSLAELVSAVDALLCDRSAVRRRRPSP